MMNYYLTFCNIANILIAFNTQKKSARKTFFTPLKNVWHFYFCKSMESIHLYAETVLEYAEKTILSHPSFNML